MESLFEGFLTKSPPSKRIWRARWRRRWFVLKQGDLPGQFFLEYYTDRNCRKLKGVIDLDQCEQVDAGLRMDKQKIKFQYMFDIKTPHRTYYLAADTENDAKNWVNLICQVCNLQETDETGQEVAQVQYYNIGPNGDITVEEQSSSNDEKTCKPEESNTTESTFLQSSTSSQAHSDLNRVFNNSANEYENDNVISYRHSVNYSNRETILFDLRQQQRKNDSTNNNEIVQPDVVLPALNYSNLPPVVSNTIERSTSLRQQNKNVEAIKAPHQRTQSLDQSNKRNNLTTGAVKKIPENLKLRTSTSNDDRINNNSSEVVSPPLSGSSGPYIPLNECFSGSPVIFPNENVPTTPLNYLNPKFYETPRSHINIGLNLTQEQLQYSPKRINNNNNSSSVSQPQSAEKSQSGRSTPTDSESVFTDDEFAGQNTEKSQRTLERNLRPSDSSVENDAVGWTYVQRFSKQIDGNPPPRPPKRISLVLDATEKLKDPPSSSDIENASPAIIESIGPKNSTSFVDESYDIPRSHQPKYFGSHSNIVNEAEGMFLSGSIVSSTPNLIVQEEDDEKTLTTLERRSTVNSRHYYSNAAPTKIEGNVFRYDFFDQEPESPAPVVNRGLKPKVSITDGKFSSNGYGMIRAIPQSPAVVKGPGAPTVDRKLKPAIAPKPQFGTNSLHRKGPASLSLSEADDLQQFIDDTQLSNQLFGMSPRTPDRLQYLDLDHTNSPQKPAPAVPGVAPTTSLASTLANMEINGTLGRQDKKDAPGVAYTTIDIVKTDAFNRVREDSEATRASKTRGKN